MKRFKFFALLCVLGVSFTSCDDKSKSEWSNYYGFSNEDVVGTYSFSNILTAFDGVEGTDRYACPDAQVTIQTSSQNHDMLQFVINCPDEGYTRTIEDYATPNENDFMLRMSTGYLHVSGKIKAYNVNAHVLRNEKQEIRLSGFSAIITYKEITNQETGINSYEPIDGEYYYFDVIKN